MSESLTQTPKGLTLGLTSMGNLNVLLISRLRCIYSQEYVAGTSLAYERTPHEKRSLFPYRPTPIREFLRPCRC